MKYPHGDCESHTQAPELLFSRHICNALRRSSIADKGFGGGGLGDGGGAGGFGGLGGGLGGGCVNGGGGPGGGGLGGGLGGISHVVPAHEPVHKQFQCVPLY